MDWNNDPCCCFRRSKEEEKWSTVAGVCSSSNRSTSFLYRSFCPYKTVVVVYFSDDDGV
jgi:hypothetical protein